MPPGQPVSSWALSESPGDSGEDGQEGGLVSHGSELSVLHCLAPWSAIAEEDVPITTKGISIETQGLIRHK